MNDWLLSYIEAQKRALDSIPVATLATMVQTMRQAWADGKQVFVFGNGGSASNASHFATDLGKGSSDALKRRFRVLSLNDNVAWMTAIGNDYSYEDVFVRQLENYAQPGDVVLTMSVSGNSPNLVKAVDWSVKNGLTVMALVGGKRGRLAELAQQVIVVNDTHYGRVEDCHMGICHMLCYAFMERPELAQS
jgi:D-sedoheptulose 7-phosphate isomerase